MRLIRFKNRSMEDNSEAAKEKMLRGYNDSIRKAEATGQTVVYAKSMQGKGTKFYAGSSIHWTVFVLGTVLFLLSRILM